MLLACAVLNATTTKPSYVFPLSCNAFGMTFSVTASNAHGSVQSHNSVFVSLPTCLGSRSLFASLTAP